MNQTQKIISTYTADVSGVCSALFELGGMTVMHDPSGCNSTYNTHDEPRWYDFDSLVFISGLSEMDAIMGNDEKLISDIVTTATELNPRFIAIAGTPIPMMTGCDIPAIARKVEAKCKIPSFGIQTNGMHPYIMGAGEALLQYSKRFVTPLNKRSRAVNIIGATPLDFTQNEVDSMTKLLTENGFDVISTWAMGSTHEAISRSAEASVNLVVSSVGMKTAKELSQRFKTPYVVGTPYGAEFSKKIISALFIAEKTGENIYAFSDFIPEKNTDGYIIGEGVMSRSLANAIKLKYGYDFKVICPLSPSCGILSDADIELCEEDGIKETLKDAGKVIADTLFEPLVPKGCGFHAKHHEAFSGRLSRSNVNLINNI